MRLLETAQDVRLVVAEVVEVRLPRDGSSGCSGSKRGNRRCGRARPAARDDERASRRRPVLLAGRVGLVGRGPLGDAEQGAQAVSISSRSETRGRTDRAARRRRGAPRSRSASSPPAPRPDSASSRDRSGGNRRCGRHVLAVDPEDPRAATTTVTSSWPEAARRARGPTSGRSSNQLMPKARTPSSRRTKRTAPPGRALDLLDVELAVAHYIRKMPNVVSGTGAFSAAEIPSASTRRVSSGSMIPSSQRRAVE